MSDAQELQRLREQIRQTVAQRDALKHAIEDGRAPARPGLRELLALDTRLSSLDTRFKTLWDALRPDQANPPSSK